MRVNRILKCIFLFTLILCLFVSVLSFISCGNRDYSKKEVEAATRELLKQAEVLNEVYWGEGIRFNPSSIPNGSYYEADFVHLNELGFNTIAELKAMTEATYSKSYCKAIYSTKLQNTTGTTTTRYYQMWGDPIRQTDPICIMVYSRIVSLCDKVEYDYDSVKATHSEGNIVYVKVDCTVTNKDGDSQNKTLTLQLVEESRGWRIKNPTHARYFVQGED